MMGLRERRIWLVAGGLLLCVVVSAVAVAYAPKPVASVTVDARENCLVTEYWQKARAIALEPGQYQFRLTDEGGIAYGAQGIYRDRRPINVLLDFDPACVSIYDTFMSSDDHAAPIAAAGLYWPDGHMTLSRIFVRVKRDTTAYAYLIDRHPDDNSGHVMLEVERGPWAGGPAARDNTVTRYWIDARANCLAVDVRTVARRITLDPGEYTLGLAGGELIYGDKPVYRERTVRNVLLDLDPADVDVVDVACDGPAPGHPVGALGLNRAIDCVGLEVHRRTALYAYVLDYHASGNSGAIELRVYSGRPGL